MTPPKIPGHASLPARLVSPSYSLTEAEHAGSDAYPGAILILSGRRSRHERLFSSRLLQINKESLVLRRRRIGVERGRRQRVGERPDRFSGESPVDRESDLPNGLVRDFERPHAFGHHRAAFYRTARRRHFHLVAVVDAFLSRQSFRDFDEEFALQMIERRLVLGPVMEMFGQTIGRTDNRELFFPAVNVHLGLEEFRHRI